MPGSCWNRRSTVQINAGWKGPLAEGDQIDLLQRTADDPLLQRGHRYVLFLQIKWIGTHQEYDRINLREVEYERD